ncbi:MAG TPA: hypothetical protein DDX05_07610 [Deltaproteobacteria bacterium]|nr:MAG: hypothetical protein A2X98_06035 [Deltaproteobacteria bacterium GWC2_66_88]HBG73472.1 hypothetical protein [Deltaproteobacteria bacterium]
MIIECNTCHARFRLDESRIKGRGARVKCRKCGDSILVLKDSAPAPSPPPASEGGFFDLGSAVRDSIGEKPAPPPIGNLIPFPSPARTVEPSAPETPFPGQAAEPRDEPAAATFAPAREKDEVDLAFDQFLSGEARESLPSAGETEAGSSAPPEAIAPTLDFTPEETLNLPPAEAVEPPIVEPPIEEPQPAEPAARSGGEGSFLISESETLAFLKEGPPVAQPEAPSGFDDISLAISSAPAEEGSSFLREPEPPSPPRWTEPPPAPDEIAIDRNFTPPSTPVMEVSSRMDVLSPPEAMPPPSIPPESPERRVLPAPESPRTRSSAGPVAAVVLAVLLVAGGYFGFTTSGRKTLEGAVPGVSALWRGKPAAPTESKYDLRNVIGYYERGGASPRILVIKGQVANLSGVEKSGIRVHAALLDNTDAVLLQQVVYAGNVLPGEAIRKADRETLMKAMGNRFGEGLANMHVAPGKAIPFMVVFFDAPANLESYKLEAKDGE